MAEKVKSKKGETVEVIKVAFRKNERVSKTGTTNVPETLGRREFVAKSIFKEKVFKEKLGAMGKMTVTDYEAKNYTPYGLTPRDILIDENGARTTAADKEITNMAKENAELREMLAQLQAQNKEVEAPAEEPISETPVTETPKEEVKKGRTAKEKGDSNE